MFKKILLMLGEDDLLSKKLIHFLKKKTKKLTIFYSSQKINKNKIFKVSDGYYDFIFCFRSKYILKPNDIKKAYHQAINFHPGPPEYRGFGCVNYALYESATSYGVTTHVVNNQIDNGKIIDVFRFKIKKIETVNSLLKKTHKYLFEQSIKIINKIYKNFYIVIDLKKKFSKEKWSKKIKTKKQLDKFYKIDINSKKKFFEKKLRATYTKKFKPYIVFYGKNFILE